MAGTTLGIMYRLSTKVGNRLLYELGRSGWALTQFCGLSNPPAVPKAQPVARLAEYEGRYRA